MEKLKLLYITQCYGGVGTYIRQVIESIDYNTFSLEVIGPYDESFAKFCEENSVDFHVIEMKRGLSPSNDISALFSIRKYIKKSNPDIIHLHSSKAGVLGRLACASLHKRVVFTPHAISYMSFSGIKRSIFFFCEVFMKRFTDRVLTCSYSEAMRLHFEVGLSYKKMSVIHNSIPIPDDIPPKKSFSKDSDIYLGSIMRLTTQKNPLIYIETAYLLSQKYKNIHFSILGAGMTDDLKSKVLEKIKEYNLTDKFEIINWGERSKSIDYLDSLDLFILPSLFEALPLAALEAMSRGVPCVVSKDDGCRDLVNNAENGFSCITPEQYSQAISRLIENPIERDLIRKNAFEYIKEHHNINKFIKKLEHYYLSIYNDKISDSNPIFIE